MKREAIIDMWKEDCRLDNIDLDTESLKIPTLHGKYLGFLSEAKLKLKALENKKKSLYITLYEYFQGDLNTPEALDSIGREPWQKKILKGELSDYVAGDSDMIEMNLKIAMARETVEILEEILKSVNNRNWIIRNAIEHRKFMNGSG